MGQGERVLRIPKRKMAALGAIAIVLVGALLAWRSGVISMGLPASPPVQLIVIGHEWWWEFDYPDLGIKTANELHVPTGTDIQVELLSVDVVHTLAIPEVAVQADAIPGVTTQMHFRVDTAGELGGECSEICGIAHNLMRMKVVAESPEDFAAWAATQQSPAAAPETERQWAGYDLVTTACAKCHSLDPAEARTDLAGPNLAHLMSRSVFAGASFNLNEANLRRWMRNTQEMKAGNDMIVELVKDDYEAVIEYLLMLK